MGYACPVCATPQADAEHLANHLAFTALLGEGDHEAWLDDHVEDWESRGPDELAPAVAELASETEHETVFEDTTDRGSGASGGGSGEESAGHDHGPESFEDRMARELGGDDAADGERDAPPGSRRGADRDGGADDVPGVGELDEEAREILEEAHEMTKQMQGQDQGSGSTDADGGRTGSTDGDEGESQ